MELSGMLGEFWKKQAEQELQKVKSDLDSCRITVGVDGVARNYLGRALSDDMLEKLMMVASEEVKFYLKPTRRARKAETAEAVQRYASREVGAEEMHEMRSAFGTGTTVVDVLTGRKYTT
jgi:hypothetical protein